MKGQAEILMDFQSLNHLNIIINTLSGTFLPVTSKKTPQSAGLIIYLIVVWIVEMVYLTVCVIGMFYAPRERALKDSTVNIVISLEVIVLIIYLHSSKKLLRKLIKKMNNVLSVDNEMLRNITLSTVKPLERPLKIYTVVSVASLVLWTLMPLLKVFQKKEFYYVDFQVPAVLSKQPFSVNVFIVGIVLHIVGGVYTLIRKISLDIYTMHLILLMTAQYKYLRKKLVTILRQESEVLKDFENRVEWQTVSRQSENVIKQEMRNLTYHYETVIEMAIMLKKLLSPNVGILYVNNVFRFCFLSFMFVMSSTEYFEKCLIVVYIIGALTQFYILCSCIQGLLEASTTVADDAFHEEWYFRNLQLQRAISMIILANKLECRLSSFRNIDLTLPSFMSILNQAYSVCLFLLNSRKD